MDHSGVEFGRLCRRLLVANQEYLRIEADRWNGEYTTPVAPSVAGQNHTDRRDAPVDGPLFSIVVDKYMAELPRADRSGRPLKAELLKFIQTIGGDRPITSITKADGRTYKEDLLNRRQLTMLTTAKHISAVVAVYRWAQQQGYVASGLDNPMQGLAPSKRIIKKTMVQRRPFTDAELLRVVGSEKFLKQRTSNPARY